MIVLRDPKSVELIPSPVIREFVQQRFELMSDGDNYDPEEHGYFIVIDVGDQADDVESATGCPLLTSWFNDAHFGDADFAPMFEYVEDHGSFYEIVYILNDGGFAQVVVVPKLLGIDPRLSKLCADFV
jgi:hypothetical protein